MENPFHPFQHPDTIAGMAGGTALVILPNINRYGHRTNSFAGSDRSGGRLWRFAFATMAAEFFPPQAARVTKVNPEIFFVTLMVTKVNSEIFFVTLVVTK